MEINHPKNNRSGQLFNGDQPEEDQGEQTPLLAHPPRTPIANRHFQMRSFDCAADEAQNLDSGSPLCLQAPGRRHDRSRSLEEWAGIFGITGIQLDEGVVDMTREDSRQRHPKFAQSTNRDKGSATRPPRPPQIMSWSAKSLNYSPSSARNLRLDRIVEAERDENDSGDHDGRHDQDYDNSMHGTALMQGPAMGGSYETVANRIVNPRIIISPSNSNVTTSPCLDAEVQRLDSNIGSTLFSAPSHLTNGGGYCSTSNASPLDDNAATAEISVDCSQSQASSRDHAKLERWAKFEREQEIMFQEKKRNIQRELFNVLERSAVKSHRENQAFINEYMLELEKERAKLVAQWREEWEKEVDYLRQRDPKRRLFRQVHDAIGSCLESWKSFFSGVEVFISNMPLTIAALALGWVSMGCVWFKFIEENIDACHHVHFFSPQCTFPEFPGCFECDVENRWYILGLNWHYFCTTVSITFCSMIILKVIIAWKVVVDELSNPTTSTPCGVFFVAMVCDFAGRGTVGEIVVLITATFHLILGFWFLYMALFKYRLYPDPGWFPNTCGISYAAVKCFMYFPIYGDALMIVCLTFFLGVFFVSGLRIATNPKIAAPICWFMLTGPSLTLYSLTLISQPSPAEELAMEKDPRLEAHFTGFLRRYYLPLQHFLFACSLIGLCSAIHGVWTRWGKFKRKAFSPAHVAFVTPTLAHTNAIQSYRATIEALSGFPPGGWFCTTIYTYWCICLFTGTIVTLIFTYKFLTRLLEWTRVDVAGEEAPPPPYETMTHEMIDERGAHETMMAQTFVNPAVLEANESGALMRVRRGTEDYRLYGPFVRTRQVTARGFDPTLDDSELREERAAILDWVAKNAPRKRHHTMSIPDVLHLQDKAGRNVYGAFLSGIVTGVEGANNANVGDPSNRRSNKHTRSKTSIPGY